MKEKEKFDIEEAAKKEKENEPVKSLYMENFLKVHPEELVEENSNQTSRTESKSVKGPTEQEINKQNEKLIQQNKFLAKHR